MPESVDHVEVGAVYKPTANMVFRLNSYAMRIEDIIYRNSSAIYSQEGKNYFLGVESQYEYTYSSALNFGANLNYAHAVDSSWQALERVAHYNAAAHISYALWPNVKLNSFLKRVSARSRAPQDSRLEVPGYTALDVSVVYKYKSIDVALYIKNILDQEIYYVSPPNTYSSDFLRQKRNYSVSVSWKY
jgi:outer membrane receptor protein involved in Fe transport